MSNSEMASELLRLIEFGSFKNFWYWLFFAVAWSRVSYFSMNIGYHEARLSKWHGGHYSDDFAMLMRINADRYTEIFDSYGPFLIGVLAFILATIGYLGFGFGFEIMQAVFLLMAPLSMAHALDLNMAYKVKARSLDAEQLYRVYLTVRRMKQVLGTLTVFVAAIWTAYQIVLLKI